MIRTNALCPDCTSQLSRRDFVRVIGASAAAAAVTPLAMTGRVSGAPTKSSAAETAVKQLYETLTEKQSSVICLPFDHPSRFKISANWEVTEPLIGSDFYTTEQRALINEILKGCTSEDGYDRFIKQMDDDSGGISEYACAIFGQPGTDQFQFELTGRHLTIRADGNSVPGAAFGGPIVYGHGEESDPAQNLFHYQTKKVNEVFQALDAPQREKALLKQAPKESDVPLQGKDASFPGMAVNGLSSDQKELVESVIRTLLAPYRQEDVDEVSAILKETGGLDQLHMAFYESGDLGNDQVWDVWRIEGPSFVWHFRGAPHVHAYINIGLKS